MVGKLVLIMPSSLGFWCLYSCACLLPSGYLWHLGGFAVSDCGLLILQAYVSTPGKPVLLGKIIGTEICGTVSAPAYRQEIRRMLSQVEPWLRCLDGS